MKSIHAKDPAAIRAAKTVLAMPHVWCACCRSELDARGRCPRDRKHRGTLPDPETIAEATRVYREANMGMLRPEFAV